MDTIKENNSGIIVFIPFKHIKRFIIFDLAIGTAIFYGCKAAYDHVLLDSLGTMAITETIKKFQKYYVK